MKSVTSRGFTLIESLLAFVVISLILLLFIPGLFRIYSRKTTSDLNIKKWRTFYEISQLDFTDRTDYHGWPVDDNVWVSEFIQTELGYTIYFNDGSRYDVKLESLQ